MNFDTRLATRKRAGLLGGWILGLLMLACSKPPLDAPRRDGSAASATTAMANARAFPAAEKFFRNDRRWLGADGASTIPLDEKRTLWLFGDTFVAKTGAFLRNESEMVRNSIAIQNGAILEVAGGSFRWKRDADATPASFFPERGDRWYWPGHGLRVPKGPLIVFLFKLRATPNVGLGFASDGHAIAWIDNPDDDPDDWRVVVRDQATPPFDFLPATAVVVDERHVVAVAIRQSGTHAGSLVRWTVDGLAKGDMSSEEWWAGDEAGWRSLIALPKSGPVEVFDDAGAECSLHWDQAEKRWIHVASYGFGATTIGLRSASRLVGPWSTPTTIYRPPESDGPKPFVYAAKAHPELRASPTSADLVVTYATNSFDFGDLFAPEKCDVLYWPRVVLVRRPLCR